MVHYIDLVLDFLLLGKNAYALTVLKQVELKIDGKSIDDRYMLLMIVF